MKLKRKEMDFEKLWEYQQGAVFLKKDEIYAHRKNLAEFFFRMGGEYKAERLEQIITTLQDSFNELVKKQEDSVSGEMYDAMSLRFTESHREKLKIKKQLAEALEFINSISLRELDSQNVINRQILLNRIKNENTDKNN